MELTQMSAVAELPQVNVNDALRGGRQRSIVLMGFLDRNQGLPTFTGRLTLEQFADLTVVHNRKWASDAGQSMDVVTQREIIDAHAIGLSIFILQGLIAATTRRATEELYDESVVDCLRQLQNHVGHSTHYGLPPVTLVLQGEPEVRMIKENDDVIAARLMLPAGRLFIVADGQHRREAARRVREFLNDVIANRRVPRNAKIYRVDDTPLADREIEAWIAVQETFRTWTLISYEAHIGLSIDEARQMFTNYNCHVKPVKAELNLTFDHSNPINQFAKNWLHDQIATASNGAAFLDLRQMAAINGLLFLGKTTIKSAPYNVDAMTSWAKEFWTCVLQAPAWSRERTLLREAPVLKGLAKAWFYVFLARRNTQPGKADKIRAYIRNSSFDNQWLESVSGLSQFVVPTSDGTGFRFSPAHNDIVTKIVAHALN
jgi:hypothetical protein